MAAYNTQIALAGLIRTDTDYSQAHTQAHDLARQILSGSGDIDPDYEHRRLHVRLDRLPTGAKTRALAQLCDTLTATQTVYPGTDLVLTYTVK